MFPVEQRLYSKNELKQHITVGGLDDSLGFKGHPGCIFCKTRYFGDDEFRGHCRESHETCFLCERSGIHHFYYRNYAHLVSINKSFEKDSSDNFRSSCHTYMFFIQ